MVSTDQSYFILTHRLRCQEANCRKTFTATNPEVLKKMPRACTVPTVLPFVLTHRGGVDISVLQEMEGAIGTLAGGNFRAFRKSLNERHALRAQHLELSYASLCSEIWYPKACARSSNTARQSRTSDVPYKFERGQLLEFVASASYLRDVYVAHLEKHLEDMLFEMMTRDASVLEVDHSHKILKLLSRLSGEKIFDAALQFTNEFKEIVLLHLMLGTSQQHGEWITKRWIEIRRRLGQRLPQLITTDQCCVDRPMIERAIPEFASAAAARSAKNEQYRSLPTLRDPAECIYVSEIAALENLITALSSRADELKRQARYLALGLDGEWPVSFDSETTFKMAVLQLSVKDDVLGDIAWCIHLRTLRTRSLRRHSSEAERLPQRLIAFLCREDVVFCGRQIGGDRLKLARDYEIESLNQPSRTLDNWIELGGMASRCHPEVTNGSIGLEGLVATVLKRSIEKTPSVRLSNWEAVPLSVDQVKYACRDAWASLLVFLNLRVRPDRSIRIGDEVSRLSHVGRYVRQLQARARTGSPSASSLPPNGTIVVTPISGMAVDIMPSGREARALPQARGIVMHHFEDSQCPAVLHGVRASKTRVAVKIEVVLSLAAVVPDASNPRPLKFADLQADSKVVFVPRSRLSPRIHENREELDIAQQDCKTYVHRYYN